jgi:hypothetical protein
MKSNAMIHCCEESVRGCPAESLYSTPKVLLPFTDLAFAHIAMLSVARILDVEKKLLINAAVDIFTKRFGDRIAMEAQAFLELLQTHCNSYRNPAPELRASICVWLAKARQEVDKLRTLEIPVEELDSLLTGIPQ